jgi:hypothetical protein
MTRDSRPNLPAAHHWNWSMHELESDSRAERTRRSPWSSMHAAEAARGAIAMACALAVCLLLSGPVVACGLASRRAAGRAPVHACACFA